MQNNEGQVFSSLNRISENNSVQNNLERALSSLNIPTRNYSYQNNLAQHNQTKKFFSKLPKTGHIKCQIFLCKYLKNHIIHHKFINNRTDENFIRLKLKNKNHIFI